jgi:hypothetical protein
VRKNESWTEIPGLISLEAGTHDRWRGHSWQPEPDRGNHYCNGQHAAIGIQPVVNCVRCGATIQTLYNEPPYCCMCRAAFVFAIKQALSATPIVLAGHETKDAKCLVDTAVGVT